MVEQTLYEECTRDQKLMCSHPPKITPKTQYLFPLSTNLTFFKNHLKTILLEAITMSSLNLIQYHPTIR